MTPHKFSYEGIFDLERKHHEDILKRKPLKHILEGRRIRFVNAKGRFDFCYFGDFYFDTGNVMVLITNDLSYTRYHRPDQMSNTLWSTVPVIFAGVETGFKDDDGNEIFTYDYCDFGRYRLMVQYLSFDEPCLMGDNHSVPLSWAKEHGGFRKSGTTLYDLRKDMFEVFNPWEIWRINQFNDAEEREKAHNALKEPAFIDGLPAPNKRWPRTYSNIDDVVNDDAVLVYFRSSDKETVQDEDGELYEQYACYIDNYPRCEIKQEYEMVVDHENYQQLLYELMLKAHRTPEKCFVLCDFFESIVMYDNCKKEFAQYFKPLSEYQILNVVVPRWIVEELIIGEI
ncbi:MAG: hypothetical protein J6P65_04350 [Bacteroidales bacterium]|nr:hypothetical protein [Bacteroidales bacterium]